MKIPGERVKRERWVHTSKYVVAVAVEAVIPGDDPSEACFEPHTVEFLRSVEEHAQHDDVAWLKEHGRVYRILDAA